MNKWCGNKCREKIIFTSYTNINCSQILNKKKELKKNIGEYLKNLEVEGMKKKKTDIYECKIYNIYNL